MRKKFQSGSVGTEPDCCGKIRMVKKILIFGGTTEGRRAAESLLQKGLPCLVCVATDYGAEVMEPHPLLEIRTGRMDREKMADLIGRERFACAIDATHPHAALVSEEIRAACRQTGLARLRLGRRTEAGDGAAESLENVHFVDSPEEAGAFLAAAPGGILVTTGSKELEKLAQAVGDPSRITARVLPSAESLEACARAGLTGRQIVAMQGPFDLEMNCALIRHTGASWLLTKETGAAGGYPEKLEAAKACGIGAVVIHRPGNGAEEGRELSLQEAVEAACRCAGLDGAADGGGGISAADAGDRRFDEDGTAGGHADSADPMAESRKAGADPAIGGNAGPATFSRVKAEKPAGESVRPSQKQSLALVGIGVGVRDARTLEADRTLAEAELVFGAGSVLHLLEEDGTLAGKQAVPVYESRAILQHLRDHPEISRAAVAYSGDSGFYSGASSMLALIRRIRQEKAEEAASLPELRTVCGISCVSWFAARAGIAWQDLKILSSHGRFCNVTGQVRRNPRSFLLLSGAEDVRRTGTALADAQQRGILGDLDLILGYELSRPEEEVRPCSPQDLCGITKEGLYVLYIGHEDALDRPVVPGLPDSAFIRGKAPMTSSEIRALSLCRLELTSRAVVWDVGAGTGSVSVEAALTCPEGQVWAIERHAEAVALLRENRDKFCLMNMEIVEGRAPEALEDLPAPTHVFIGGSGGEIGQILRLSLEKNPNVRIVVNCITAETLAALQAALPDLPVRDVQCVQVSVQRGEMLGRYHYLRALNPVFILSMRGAGTGE